MVEKLQKIESELRGIYADLRGAREAGLDVFDALMLEQTDLERAVDTARQAVFNARMVARDEAWNAVSAATDEAAPGVPEQKGDKMISILAHTLTPAQLAELGKEPTHIKAIDAALAAKIASCPADAVELEAMAASLCLLAGRFDSRILAGSGSPAFTAVLGREAARAGVVLVFAHSERVSTDAVQPDGSVKKVSEFRHVKFFEV